MSVSALAMAQKKLSSKPNIVIIYADDLGINDLSCYGAKEIKTPNIDKLAQNGVRFTNAYAAAATCTP
ncbi:sulfatase-like hydrolase/transferase, partial [Ornithobacterium rhinotracheale]